MAVAKRVARSQLHPGSALSRRRLVAVVPLPVLLPFRLAPVWRSEPGRYWEMPGNSRYQAQMPNKRD
jgi:hypothetical protein